MIIVQTRIPPIFPKVVRCVGSRCAVDSASSCFSRIWRSGLDALFGVEVSREARGLLSKGTNVIGRPRGNWISHRRGFLGCGDGEEGDVLSKVYEERRLMGYSPEQLFDVVTVVDLYHGFVPWCQRSEILRQYPDGSFDTELEFGFKFLVESYVSHVELTRPKLVKTTA